MSASPSVEPVTVHLARVEAIEGVLVGTAVGDALGLPMEGLSAARQQRLFPGPLRHRFIGHFGLTSDDTEHTFMLAQALLEFPEDPCRFQRTLARKLRWWLVSLPAGVGFATLRSIVKLWIGIPPHRSGIYSAGNGPAMRSAVLGVVFASDPARRRQFVQASSEITHRDPRAGIAALAIAETAVWMANGECPMEDHLHALAQLSPLPEWQELTGSLQAALRGEDTVAGFAHSIGSTKGVSGYAFRSVPVAIFAALRHPDDFPRALCEAIAYGGDTDTVGAMVGALVGARVGVKGIPEAWHRDIMEWPRRMGLLTDVSQRLATASSDGPISYCWPAIPLRNLAFLAIVLAHGFRRLLPPY